jgi:hypothetical protein
MQSDSIKLLNAIRPTRFKTLKTEALFGDYYWIEDQPLEAERNFLIKTSMTNRLIIVNLKTEPDALMRVIDGLQREALPV